ncbi:eukaryotic translation initiation factor 3 subunit C-like [Oppia nitens]|uniref:eukaryotic translation initiation factor 3 subunit C-like n=1 Tax=Oppia nitens TaxID=1686743 RepID=UPI0023DB56FA|nr:eukaryotic translation initiation factor 3 subunit C-like [Oppia nitens]
MSKASKFFANLSETESSEEESDEEVGLQNKTTAVAYSFSDDEEEAKRIVRSAREKRYEELHTIIKQIRNHKKIKDISKLLTSFENLDKAFKKAKPVIDKEESGATPKFYTKCLVELEDFVNEVWEDREGRKNMNKNNSKSLATLRQKLRKYNKDFESDINGYRENPDEFEDEKEDDDGSGDEDDSGSDSDVGAFVGRKHQSKGEEDGDVSEVKKEVTADVKSKFLKGGSDDESEGSDDDSDWPTSSDESSSSSDDEKYGDNLAAKFLKKEGDAKESKKRERVKVKEPKLGKRRDDDDEGEWEKVKGGVASSEKPKMFAKDAEINHLVMNKKLIEVLAMRGKKRIDRSDQIEMLTELLSISDQNNLGPALAAKILLGILSSLFDYNSNINSCMKYEMWEKCLDTCEQAISLLTANPDISVGENIAEESELFTTSPYRVHGCILTLIERMDEEFTKILQGCDAHSPEYIERLKDETRVCAIIESLQLYLETNSRGTASDLCRIYIIRIDHLYYKFDPQVFKKKEQLRKLKELEEKQQLVNGDFRPVEIVIADETGEPVNKTETEEIIVTSMDILNELCKFIYARDVTDRIRTQAILCHIYHHALHDNWFEARDLMLMSYLQHNIHKSDIPLQVMYNRALVQLGLCAFRHGTIRDAHTSLLDIQIQGRAKELLAQGLLPRQQERTPEQEKLEKRRQIPFHKHINLELLECVYLVSAMLLEIPDVASNEFSVRKKMISRSFYNQLRKNEEQPLVGLPESMREHVVAASKVMRIGNWRQCQEYIINDKMNSKVWNLFYQADKVRDMLAQKIREESLRAYLFTYSYVYDSISIKLLAEMFDLESSVVHSIISKMIINEELMASLDEPTQTAVMHRTEPSRIQGLALQCAEKINSLVEHNERLWEIKQIPLGQLMTQGNQRYYNQDGNYRNYNRQDRQGGGRDRDGQDRNQYRRGSHRQDYHHHNRQDRQQHYRGNHHHRGNNRRHDNNRDRDN